jgi:uncharacterized protein
MKPFLTKFLFFPITKIVVGIGICFGLLVLVRNFITKPIFHSLISQKNIADTLINYISVALLLASYYYLFRVYEKREVTELSSHKIAKEGIGGFALGFLLVSVVIGVLFGLGYYSVISISSASYMLAPFSLLVLAAIIEDLFIRGLILRTMENWIGTYLGLLVVTVTEAQHVFNPNSNFISFIGDLVWGFSLATLYIFSKRVWLPFFFHLGWNFAQPFYGSNLSGLDDMGRVIQAKFEGPHLLTGGVYGIEASLISIPLLLAIGILFLYLSIRRDKIVKAKFKSGASL